MSFLLTILYNYAGILKGLKAIKIIAELIWNTNYLVQRSLFYRHENPFEVVFNKLLMRTSG